MIPRNNTAPRRRREDEAAGNSDSYVEDCITCLDRVILRLIEEADAIPDATPAPPTDGLDAV